MEKGLIAFIQDSLAYSLPSLTYIYGFLAVLRTKGTQDGY